jgi:hypothetical protein
MILLPKHLVVWEHRVIVTSFGLVGMIIIDWDKCWSWLCACISSRSIPNGQSSFTHAIWKHKCLLFIVPKGQSLIYTEDDWAGHL